MTFDSPPAESRAAGPPATPPATGRPGNGLIAVALFVVVAMIGGAVFLVAHRGGGGGTADYRDPATLAAAVRDAYGGQKAACAHATATVFLCAVSRADGSEGLYRVTVSADGRDWQVTG